LKRKLLLLNLLLLAATIAAGWRLRKEWQAAGARDAAIMRRAIKPLPPPLLTETPAAPPVQAVGYADIAQKMLFSKDRNPVVVVETAPPPPPKPMPPLPVLYGVMNIDGPMAIVAQKAGAANQELRPGQTIGEFKLLAVNTQQIVFEWDGKRVERKVDDMVQRQKPEGNEPTEGARSVAIGPSAMRPAAAAPPPPPPAQAKPEPGVDIGRGVRACQPGDTSPPGTVSQGMRKVVTASPFGPVCRWEPM
jgi:hypothetical protein